MALQTVSLSVDVPPGFKTSGEHRTPVHDEWFLSPRVGIAVQCDGGVKHNRIILKPLLPHPNLKELAPEYEYTGEFAVPTVSDEWVDDTGRSIGPWYRGHLPPAPRWIVRRKPVVECNAQAPAPTRFAVEFKLPEGYEWTGEYRVAQAAERYLREGKVWTCTKMTVGDYPILRKLPEPWRPMEWLPNGMWVYNNDGGWYVTDCEPSKCVDGYASQIVSVMLNIRDFKKLVGGKTDFVAPPNKCVLVRHGK